MRTLPILTLTTTALLTLVAPLANAHGPTEHAPRPASQAASIEETAFGREGNASEVSRTITVDMADTMRFSPDRLTVRRGETVRLVARNKGAVLHELVLGTDVALREHAEQMRRFPEMEHGDPYMVHVQPGQKGEILWRFTQAGSFAFACLLPGHFEAGMVGTVVVQ